MQAVSYHVIDKTTGGVHGPFPSLDLAMAYALMQGLNAEIREVTN